jgi:hypothetical protein
MNDDIRMRLFEKPGNIGLLDKIACSAPRDEDFGRTEFTEFRDNARSEESGASCNENSFIGPEVHF